MGTESGAGLADKGAAAARGRPRGKRPQVASGRVRRTRSAPTAPQAGFGNRALRPQPPRFSERWAAVWTRLYPASGPDASPLIRGKTRPGRSAPTAPQRPRPLLSARLGRAPGEPRRGAAGRVRGGRAHRASVRGAGLRSRAAPPLCLEDARAFVQRAAAPGPRAGPAAGAPRALAGLAASAWPVGRRWARAASPLGRVPSWRARPVRGVRWAARAAPRAGGVPAASGPGLDPPSVLGCEGGRELVGPAALPTRLVLLARSPWAGEGARRGALASGGGRRAAPAQAGERLPACSPGKPQQSLLPFRSQRSKVRALRHASRKVLGLPCRQRKEFSLQEWPRALFRSCVGTEGCRAWS